VTANSPATEGERPTAAEATPRQIDALVRLLGDEDPRIFSVVWDHLERIGVPALPVLESARRGSEDARVRVQAGRFLREWSRREVLRQWVGFCKSDRIDLEDGAFLVSRSEYPDLDVRPYRETLEQYAKALRGRVRLTRTTGEAVKKVSHFLFQEVGFRGNAADYYSAENSYLSRVFDRKLGIPIALAAVFLLVARRLDIPLHGVGMPAHFLLKYREPGGEVFVDVFHGGKLLSARDCALFLSEAGLPFREKYLRGISDRSILKRMLGNLLQIYLKEEDRRRSDRITAMLKLLG
jgi:regulator of sirC expression with transglutaminase-like and TPR domain